MYARHDSLLSIGVYVVLAIKTDLERKRKEQVFWDVWSTNLYSLRCCCLRWLNGNQTRVEDALSQTQEKTYVYFVVHEEEILKPFSWMCRLAYNVCMDIQRDQKKQRDLCEKVSHSPDLFYFSMMSTEPLVESVLRDETMESLSVAIKQLPEDLQAVIHYRFIDEMEYPKIADILQTSQANVRKKIQLARKRLRDAIF